MGWLEHFIDQSLRHLAILFGVAFVGAFCLYLFAKNRGTKPFSTFHAFQINVGPTAKSRVLLADAVATSLLGAIVACILSQPTTVPQAFMAGLGFTGVFSHGGSNHGNGHQ